MRRRPVLFIPVLFIPVLAAACARHATPDAALRRFVGAYNAGDWPSVWDTFDPESQFEWVGALIGGENERLMRLPRAPASARDTLLPAGVPLRDPAEVFARYMAHAARADALPLP